ncbi:MAG: putative toxin-antitoxin system toxin component, PIN family [Saprospiraceae bacterium]|nr:MAG: putative toxin-antitoxin system toxin component, PIN family [Saprospiraceae bacterium]
MENNRVVIDTNVFISAIIGQFGYPYKIINELVLTGEILICLSPLLLKEYEEVSGRERFAKKFPGFPERAKKLIKALKEIALTVEPNEVIAVISDEPDNRVLEVAVAANAYAIVTGNTNDFNFEEFRGIKIKSPKDFYEEWAGE